MYTIRITKKEDNPLYDPEKLKQHFRWGQDYDSQVGEKYVDIKALEVELTDEEFQAIKKAVLEVM